MAKIAGQYGIPTLCLSGTLGQGCENVLEQGIAGLMSITPRPLSLEECLSSARELVQDAAARLCRVLQVGMQVGPVTGKEG
ncbi:hypothetical protein SDC9_165075 [bioreactor metagenome]|uniref:Glycerate 3-kinase n=1 Tax=bioreactor metagenome TaxID=1076179 RepID=A0A645FVJ1_9ZZZZ